MREMREIKFKAWDPIKKIMINWEQMLMNPTLLRDILMSNNYVNILKDKGLNFNTKTSGYLFEERQYTGLKDKYNKEIYERDIVKVRFNLADVEHYIYLYLTDQEKRQEAVIRKIYEIPDCYYQPELSAEDIEIIGNIYEHPELIEEKK